MYCVINMSQYTNILMVLQHCIKSLTIFLCSTNARFPKNLCYIFSKARAVTIKTYLLLYAVPQQWLHSAFRYFLRSYWLVGQERYRRKGEFNFFNAIFSYFLIVSLNMYFCPSGKVPTKLFEDSLCKLYFFRSGYFLWYLNIFQKLMKFIPFLKKLPTYY